MTQLQFRNLAIAVGVGLFVTLGSDASARAQVLQQSLLAEGSTSLAAAARRSGDAARGAIVFHRQQMACASCHSLGKGKKSLGPDLTKIDKQVNDASLVESLLEPSRVIVPGYAAVSVVTSDGRILMGVPVKETADRLVLRGGLNPDELITVEKSKIAERETLRQSLMPPDQANQLGGRPEFLDLVRYVMELRDGGAQRAAQLAPSPQAVALKLPDYEKHVDHAGMIAKLGDSSFDRGEAIYQRVCANCHGTVKQVGSLPTSLRFASGRFKNGSDPYAMYQTLTHGFGMMVPQTWMVPRQKYDVIHYIREEYLKPHNGSQYFNVTPEYLAKLPRGDTWGPEPVELKPWLTMDYGPSLINTYQIGGSGRNFAYKGIAVRLDPGPGGISQGKDWMVFDHDTLRMAGAWSGAGFIDFQGIQFDGQHGRHPHVVGKVHVANSVGPGWGDPDHGEFEDNRIRGTDGKPYGPLAAKWAHYRGVYRSGQSTVISYRVGNTNVFELPGLAQDRAAAPVFTRTFNIEAREHELVLQVAQHSNPHAQLRDARHPSTSPEGQSLSAPVVVLGPTDSKASRSKSSPTADYLVAGLTPEVPNARWTSDGQGNLRLRLPAGQTPLRFTLSIATIDRLDDLAAVVAAKIDQPQRDLSPLLHGGPPQWPQKLTTHPILGHGPGPFSVDVLMHPVVNPWQAQMRFTGLDFLAGGHEAALCTWDGDVWIVGDLLKAEQGLSWQRIATGLFQPLGLKIVAGRIYVTCRDQIVVLHDLNGDRETDFYENFNNDQQVTEHFHEFAMGLQTDSQGNFYYAKAARHALPAIVPQHGTLLRVSADGKRTDIVANGFRAPNGVCVNPDGTFFVTDQEGHWTPKNRVNLVKPGKFYGNMLGYHGDQDPADSAMEQPVCWITNSFDRSPAEPLWVAGDTWKPLAGALLNLSYGYGRIHVILHEKVGDQMQGGMCALELPDFPTGIIRGRFNPADGQLYTCGMFAWAGNATQPGGFYRVRYTGGPVYLPIGLSARKQGMRITFAAPLDRESATLAKNYAVKVWSLKRSERYGSDHINEHPLAVKSAALSEDGKTVILEIPEIAPTRCMEIKYDVRGSESAKPPVRGTIHNTIHTVQ